MNHQIFSLAIAIPMVLVSTLPSLANPVEPNLIKFTSVQPTATIPTSQVIPASSEQELPIDQVIAPGPNGVRTKPPRGPQPPRREELFGIQKMIPAGLDVNPAQSGKSPAVFGY